MKRFLSLLLSIVMALSLLPISALADEGAPQEPVQVSGEITPDPAEEPVQDPPAQDPPAQEPVDAPADPPAQEPGEESMEEPTEEPTEEPAEELVEEPEEEPAEEPIEEPAEEPKADALLRAALAEGQLTLTVTEDMALSEDLALPEGATLTIESGTFTVPEGMELTVENGAKLAVLSGAKLVNDGTVSVAELGTCELAEGVFSGNPVAYAAELTSLQLMSVLAQSITVTTSTGKTGIEFGNKLKMVATVLPRTSNQTVEWSIDDSSSTGSTIDATGTLTAGSVAGTAKVYATAKDGSGVTGMAEIQVVEKLTTTITIKDAGNTGVTSVEVGETIALTTESTPASASNEVEWSIVRGGAYATIDENGELKGEAKGTATVRATAKDGSGVYAEKNYQVVGRLIETITIAADGDKDAVPVGKTLLMKATIAPEEADIKSVEWSVKPAGSATITSGGVLTGVSVGDVVVTATAKDGSGVSSNELTIRIDPKNATSIAIASPKSWVSIGEELELKATVKPTDAAPTITWEVDDDSIGSVDPDEGSATNLTGVAEGTVTVTATATNSDGTTVTSTKKIKVEDYKLEIVGAKAMRTGSTLQLSTRFLPSNLTRTTVEWEITEGSELASISSNGLVRATRAGRIKVAATTKDGLLSAEHEIEISPSVADVVILNDGANVTGTMIALNMNDVDGSLKLTAETTPDEARQTVSWSISPSNVAEFVPTEGDDDNAITVTGLKSGTATITARATDGSGKYASVKVKISRLAVGLSIVSTLEEDGGVGLLTANKSTTLKVQFIAPEPDNRNVTWELDDSTYATINASGVLKAKYVDSEQTVTVTATAKDGSGVSNTYEVRIVPAVSKVVIMDETDAVPGEDVCGKTVTIDLNAAGAATRVLRAVTEPTDAKDGVKWTTSDAKGTYGKMSDNGDGSVYLEPGTKNGAVTLTATATDGSNKKAAVKVEYVRYATSINILNAPENLGAGKSVNLTTDVGSDANLTNRAVKWSILPGEGADYAKISSSGRLTANAKIPYKMTVTVRATYGYAPEGKEAIYDEVAINITPVVDAIALTMADLETGETRDVTGKTVNLDWANLPGDIQLTATASPFDASQEMTWSSNNQKVATVDKDGLVTIVAERGGTATITARATDGSNKQAVMRVNLPNASKVIIQQDGVDVTGKTLNMDIYGNSGDIQLTAIATPAGAKGEFVWTTSNAAIVLVDDSGLVTLPENAKAGTATITATASDGSGKKATVKIKTVKLLQAIDVTNWPDELANNKSLSLRWTVNPTDATNKSVTWSLVDSAAYSQYLTVSASGQLRAKNVTEEIENVEVQAIAKDSGMQVYVGTLRLVPGAGTLTLYDPDGKNVTSGILAVDMGVFDAGVQLSVRQYGSTGWIDDPEVTWKSSATSTMTVEGGLVVPKKAGRATITATTTSGTKTSASVTVVFSTLATGITIVDKTGTAFDDSDNPASVITGKTLQMKAVIAPDNATNKAVTWSLADGDKQYASISSGGLLTAKTGFTEVHEVTVTATAKDGSDVSAEQTVTIYPAATRVQILNGDSQTVTGSTITLDVGETPTFTVSITPDNAQQEVKWKSSNAAIATINETSGEVTPNGSRTGTVRFTATATDGSGKSAYVNVKFVKYVTSITIERYSGTPDDLTVNPGGTLRLKAIVDPADASNKAVTWTIEEAADRVFASINATSGVITAKKISGQTEDKEIIVTATAKDGSKITETAKITIKYAG